MSESAVQKSLTLSAESLEDNNKSNTSFPDAIKELGKAIHERYPKRTSNLTQRNVNGMIVADTLTKYMKKNFGANFEVLTELVNSKNQRVTSVNGWGTDKFIEVTKGIQASFEQTELPSGLRRMLGR